MMSRTRMPDVIRVWMLRSCMMVLCGLDGRRKTWHGGLDSPESSIGSWNASKTAYAFKKVYGRIHSTYRIIDKA